MRRSITAKTRSERIRDSLMRRADFASAGFDRGVPNAQILPASRPSEPTITIGTEHTLSPFILHLKHEPIATPAELIEESERQSLRANLLVAEELLIPVERVREDVRSHTEQDLVIRTEDFAGQIAEEISNLIPETRPLTLRIRLPRINQKKTLERRAAPLPIETLLPIAAPADLIERFDLPEQDGDDESDTVELNGTEMVEVEPERAHPRFAFFTLPHGWQRAMAAFVLVSFAFTLPLHAMQIVHELQFAKTRLLDASSSALASIRDGAGAAMTRDASGASASFGRAEGQFHEAEKTLSNLGATSSLILSALPQTQSAYRSGKRLVSAGEAMARAGERLSDGFVAMEAAIDPSPTDRLAILSTYVHSVLPDLEAAERSVALVNPKDVPSEHAEAFQELSKTLPALVASLNEFAEFSDMMETVLGGNGAKRYLLVFQNNTELRPTGGFMGSFAELDVKDGEIVRLSVPGGGTYDLQGSLRQYVAAPAPLSILSPRWEFQDANWFADFPTSARQILQFYGHAGQASVDGVIAVNATFVNDLLTDLGPVEMPAYGRTITSENFLFEAQKIVELEYDREENKPKAFIGDLAHELLGRVKTAEPKTFLALADRLNVGVTTRDVQMYFTDEELQKRVLALGWGGDVKQTDGDYLMISHTNLGGGKTDGVIADRVQVLVNIDEDGSIKNTVTITRDHAGMSGALFTGVNNVDFVRVYVPKGSELLSASGFTIPDESLFETPDPSWEIDDDLAYSLSREKIDTESGTRIFEESGKTVFGNWIQTRPGSASTVTFSYRLPFHLTSSRGTDFLSEVKRFFGAPDTKSYHLLIQKQPGVLDRTTQVSVDVPESLNTLWSSSGKSGPGSAGQPIQATFTNSTDAMLSALFEAQT